MDYLKMISEMANELGKTQSELRNVIDELDACKEECDNLKKLNDDYAYSVSLNRRTIEAYDKSERTLVEMLDERDAKIKWLEKQINELTKNDCYE